MDEDGSPIVRFPARHEGEVKDEVFIPPAEVKVHIPVVDQLLLPGRQSA